MTFTKHAELVADRAATVADRAASAAKHLGYLMPNMGGPREKSRRLLTSVTTSRLMYAAPFWVDTMSAKGWKKLAAIHRRSQLRVACSYRTVSHEAGAVISGIPPISLLAKERAEIFRGRDKAEARRDLIAKWQEEWDNGVNGKGRWTHKLIGRLDEWLSCKAGQVTYHLTQLLSGHGCFGSYLHRFHLLETDACAQCGHVPDDPEHAIFSCELAVPGMRRAGGGGTSDGQSRPVDDLVPRAVDADSQAGDQDHADKGEGRKTAPASATLNSCVPPSLKLS